MSICVVGALNVDWVAHVRSLPQPGETVMATSLSRHVGGKGANQAVAAARAGSATRLIGRTGSDASGDWLLRYLNAADVDTRGVARDEQAPTGQAFITLSATENAIVVVAGANERLTAVESPHAILAGSRVLLAQLETALDPVATLFECSGPWVNVLNAAPARPGAEALIALCDILVVNETELAYLVDRPLPPEPRALATAARNLMTGRCRQVVVTLGRAGALVADAQGVQCSAGRPVPVVDTVGAGDCFCGVLAAALDQGLPLGTAVERANVAASIAVGRRGAAEAMPTRLEIDAALEIDTAMMTGPPG